MTYKEWTAHTKELRDVLVGKAIGKNYFKWNGKTIDQYRAQNYTGDLNLAITELEGIIEAKMLRDKYLQYLLNAIDPDNMEHEQGLYWVFCHASADARCFAFVKTMMAYAK